MAFLVLGAVNAAESINVHNTEDSNLIEDNEDSLSTNNKLEVSNEDSISETNIVNSHDDNLGGYPDEDALKSNSSYYEDNDQNLLTSSNVEVEEEYTLSYNNSSSDAVVAGHSSDNEVIADDSTDQGMDSDTPVSTKLTVTDTHYAKSATYFDVTLKDSNGTALSNQKVSLKVKGKTYSAYTNAKGIASIKAKSLAVGSYTVAVSYEGNENYSSSSLSKKVKVLSSVTGSNSNKYYTYTPMSYKLTFWKGTSPLANKKVTFKISGRSYTKTTNKKGVASFKVYLPAGKHALTVTNPYSKEQISKKIVVNKANTKIAAKYKTTYVLSKDKGSFSIILKTEYGRCLINKTISFTYGKQTVTAKTNENGKATITIPVLSKGTHKISFKYNGSDNYLPSSGSAKLVVVKPTTKVSASDVKMVYNDGTKFKVKLTSIDDKVLANKTVKLKVKKKILTAITNKKGIATFSLDNIGSGNHTAVYYYSSIGTRDYSHGSNSLIITKADSKLSAKDLTMKHKDGSCFKVTVKDKSGKLLKGVGVKSIIDGKSFKYKTNSKGVAKLKITLNAGYYSVKTKVSDSGYKSDTVTKKLIVKGTKFVAKSAYGSVGKSVKYSVKLVNEKNKPVKGKKVVFNINNKNKTAKTNSKGIATVKLGVLSKGTHKIKFTHESATGSSKIYVVSKVSLKDVIKASKTVKKYISKHCKLPSTVKIGDVRLKTADYLYLISKAIINLKSGSNKKDISIKIIDSPSNPRAAKDLGYLKDYLSVAKKIVKIAESKGKMPNSVSSKVGSIGYKGIVSAFSNIMVHYANTNKMLSYVPIKAFSPTYSSSYGVVNTKNTIKDLTAYLIACKNCEVDSKKIKDLVYKLTKNCKTEREKADKIFTYVRDTISYSFYYNTRHGAYGTLTAGSGNCVDHAHLLVAMYRAAGLPARYVHGTCTFSSGHTYGHVWAQVLIGNTWTVADGTSSRNSLGKVVNWNTNSYHLQGYFSSIQF